MPWLERVTSSEWRAALRTLSTSLLPTKCARSRSRILFVTNVDEIVAAALKLDSRSRRVLVDRIAATLEDPPDPWLEEATLRAREMREGLVEEIPFAEAMRDARASLD